ncbi:tape measure protein [Microbacterium sp. NPDC089696]|uniref:tape measure protein n=1 Tax=Microbacterium sp. NPDC089696 TaxID=3364199 RepID=UPI0037FAA5B2
MATGVEVANAYVALTVRAPGIARDTAKILGGVPAAGDAAGKSLGERLAASAGKALKVSTVALGGVLAAGLGTALVKGFQRLDAIDTARAKLTGLGNDAGTVETIMQNALSSVKGTAFGLGDAATVAAQAVASGIKPGRDLEKVLGIVANTAAAAGTGLGDMGSIFSKAMTQANGVQNDVIGQLADKGLPIYQELGKVMGVTAGEVFKLASEGKVNFEMFASAATAAAGTVASEMGGTVGGSFSNFLASLGRIGAGLLGGVFPQIAPTLQTITSALGPLEGMAAKAGEKVGQVLAPAFDWFMRLVQGQIDFSPIAKLWMVLSPVAILFQALKPILPTVMQAFSDIGTAIGSALVPVLPALVSLMNAVVPLLTTALVTALPIVVGLVQALSAAVSFLAPILIGVVTSVVEFVAANADWISGLGIAAGVIASVIGAVSLFRSVQLGLIAATYGAQGAMLVAGGSAKVYAVAMGVVTTAQKVAAVATRVFNAALKANPIGIIITAITALVAGLVWFFSETELGKTIWAEFTRFLGEAWANVAGFFTDAWQNVIQPVFKAIGDIAVWVYETILKPVFDGIAAVVGFVAGMFKFHFDLIVNAFRLVGALANWFWVNALQPAFAAVGAAATWLWQNAIKPAFEAIGAVFNWLWLNVVKPVFDGWAVLFQWLWANVLSPVFGFIGTAVQALGTVFSWLYNNIVKPVWDGISKSINAAWLWIDAHIFTPFKVGIDQIAKGFEVAKAAIEKTWDGIKKAAAVPINFVLSTVWNNGLLKFWNSIVDTLGLKDMKLKPAAEIAFASGGVMPGYTPGRDVHQFFSPTAGRLALSGGEAIMRPEFTRLVGGAAGVDALNAAARNGRLPFGDGPGNFFGDVWDTIANAASVAWEFISNPGQAIKTHIVDKFLTPVMGGPNLFSNLAGAVPRALMNATSDLFAAAAPKAQGSKGMGWEAMWNIVRSAVPGAVMTSNYRSPGANAGVGGVKGSYHTQGRAIDLVPANMDIFNQVARLFPNASELIYTPAGNRQLLNGKPFAGWSDNVKRMHHNHVHLAMASGGVVPKLYDQGGWLPHGGIAVNQSGKPEPVFTSDQWSMLRDGFGGDGMEITGRLEIGEDGLAKLVDGRLRRAFPSPQAIRSQFGR